jgi:hypothetical protein
MIFRTGGGRRTHRPFDNGLLIYDALRTTNGTSKSPNARFTAGRQIVTARFLRHFNVVGCADMSDSDKTTIFETILGGFLVSNAT